MMNEEIKGNASENHSSNCLCMLYCVCHVQGNGRGGCGCQWYLSLLPCTLLAPALSPPPPNPLWETAAAAPASVPTPRLYRTQWRRSKAAATSSPRYAGGHRARDPGGYSSGTEQPRSYVESPPVSYNWKILYVWYAARSCF